MSDEVSVVRKYWQAQDPYDPETMSALRHPDWHAIWPQSGELVPSDEADILIHANYPGYPEQDLKEAVGQGEEWVTAGANLPGIPTRPVRVSGGGDTWLGESRLRYSDGFWFAVFLGEMLGGRVWKETVWWAPAEEAPSWRRPWSEPFPWTGKGAIRDTSASPGRQRHQEREMREFIDRLASDPFAAHASFCAVDTVKELPQSEEVLRGRDNIYQAFVNDPAKPSLELVDLQVVGSVGLAAFDVEEVGEKRIWVEIIHFGHDRVERMTEYRVPLLDPPEWRAHLVEPIPT